MRGRLFVLGFPEDVRRRVLSKDNIRPEIKTGTVNYEKALKIIKGIIIIDECIKDFFIYPEWHIEIIELTTTLNKLKLALRKKPIKNIDSNKKDKI